MDTPFKFILNYYDTQAELNKEYHMLFYPDDNSVEIHDPIKRRVFLKRMPLSTIQLEDLVIGNSVDIHCRQMKIMEYGDKHTQDYFQGNRQCYYVIIPPNLFDSVGVILQYCLEQNIRPFKLRSVKIPTSYNSKISSVFSPQSPPSDGVSVLFEAVGSDVESKLTSLQPKYPILTSSNPSLFYELISLPSTAVYENCSLLIIRHHLEKLNVFGTILDTILHEGFDVTAIGSFHLDKSQACEFLEVYRGVLGEFDGWAKDLSMGQVVAVAITGTPSVVNELREWVGPIDPEIGRQLSPRSIRSIYGESRILNGVHVTDLAEDGPLECQYFFDFMWNNN
ncbi:hypothetical protein GEMRC1_011298 [Eukaryota sp. GEM-RC1]